MKKNYYLRLALASLVAVAPLTSMADTFFSDSFSSGSTVNQTPTTNKTTTSTSYQSAIGSSSGSSSIAANALTLNLPSGTSVLGEIMGLFTNNPINLNQAGDTIAITVVFTNTLNILSGAENANASLNIGLFNSIGVPPNQGNVVLGNTVILTGGSQNWVGYAARIFTNGNATIFTRPPQTSGKTQDQDLLFSGASSSTAFNNPAGTSLGSTAGTVTLAQGGTYTLYFSITLTGPNALQITNQLYSGSGTGGTVLFTQTKASGANYVTNGFNGFAIGWRNSSAASQASTMTISSITVGGNVTPAGPPTITTQPVSVTVANGGTCAFSVQASGSSLTYQWHRNGTNLLNGGNISGANSSQLIISSASAADAFSVANGYYVTVTSAGIYSTDSTTNSLTLVPAKNLVWSGSGTVWDLTNSVSWLDPVNPATFNYGDSVTFDDTGAASANVTLAGSFLSASKWRITGGTAYAFSGAGSFAGTGSLVYDGSALIQMNLTNTHSGGTTISNATAYLYLQQYQGLGTGPLTLAKAGGKIEATVTGSATVGIAGDVNVNDDFTIQFDGTGTFAGVFLGNISGTAGKTLTLSPQTPAAINRYRVYGTNTVCNANIVLTGTTTDQAQYGGTVMAPYGGSGSQTYNGVISGDGGIIQRGNCTTYLNGANTYAGGTTPTAGAIGLGNNNALGAGPLNLAPENGGSGVSSGTIFASGGARTIANTVQYPSATNNQALVIVGTNDLTFTSAINLAGVDGSSTSNRTFTANNTGATTLSGIISDGGLNIGLVKNGTNTLYLNGVNTYTGLTAVNAGVLAGSGTIAGPVIVTTNASIGGGASTGIGTLHISGDLTLTNGGGFFRVNRSGFQSDQVSVSGVLTNIGAGKITVTNLGATLQVGDAFTLFNKAVSNSAAMTVTGGGVTWSNKLAINGTIQVIPSVNTAPTNMTAVVNSGKLELSWPSDHTGWHLQSQTNLLTKGLGTNWVTIPGTDTDNHYTNSIVTTNGAVFYRMVYP